MEASVLKEIVLFLPLAQLALLAVQDVATRRLGNVPILVLFLVGALAALVDGLEWTGWNLLLPAVALVAYRFNQIGGADAKVLIALSPMNGSWVAPFLLAAFLNTVALHAAMKRPPVLVALAAAHATVLLGVILL